MSEEWKSLAQQIADLKRERDALGAMLDQAHDVGEALLAAAEALRDKLAEVTRERDQYKAAYELQDAQRKITKGDSHVH